MFDNLIKACQIVMKKIFTKRNIPRITIASFVLCLTIFLNLFSAYILSHIIELVAEGGMLNLFGIIELSLTATIFLYSATMLVSKAMQTSRKLIINPIASDVAYDVVYDINKQLMNNSHEYFAKVPTGYISEVIGTGIIGVTDFTSQFLNQIVPVTLESTTAIGVASYRLGLYPGLAFAGMFALYSIYNSLTGKYIAENQKKLVLTKTEMTKMITSMLLNYENIHLLNNVTYELEKLNLKLDQVKQVNTNSFALPDKITLGQWLIISMGFAGLILLTDRVPSISEFIAINFYLLQFTYLLSSYGDGINKTRAAIISLAKVAEVLERTSEVCDDHPNVRLQIDANTPPALTFEHVSFSYDHHKPVLRDLSFTVAPGQKLGIVGLSGGGKSTIAKLLYRFYDADSGVIKINNQNIKEVGLSSLRSKIAIIPQTPSVFNDSLKNNIWYGAISKKGKNIDENLLSKAIHDASLDEYIANLKHGLDTSVGERGAQISGGQLQRIAIARAILKGTDIIIFDESTSALDSNTEREVQKNLDKLAQGKTTIVISHKLYNVKDADKIIVLQDGELKEQGTHSELLARNGLYAELWLRQSQEYNEQKNHPLNVQNSLRLGSSKHALFAAPANSHAAQKSEVKVKQSTESTPLLIKSNKEAIDINGDNDDDVDLEAGTRQPTL